MEKIKIFTSSTRICPGMIGSLLSWERKVNWVPALLTEVMAISIPLSVLYDFLVYSECTLPVVLPRYKIQETGYQRIDQWKIISRKLSAVNCSYTAGYLVYCTNSIVCDTYPLPSQAVSLAWFRIEVVKQSEVNFRDDKHPSSHDRRRVTAYRGSFPVPFLASGRGT